MKTINKYFLMALAGGLLSFTACSDEIEREASPVVDPNCPGVYFSADNNYALELEPESALEMTLKVARTNTEGAATVKVEVLSNTENVFEVPETITFEAGQAEAPLTIKFPNAEIGLSYSYALKFGEGDYNPYVDKLTYVSGSMIRIKWNPIETAIYTDGMVSVLYGVKYPLSWYVNAEYAEFPDGSIRVRVNNPYCEAFDVDDNGIYDGYLYTDPAAVINPNARMIINTDSNKKEATMEPFYFGIAMAGFEDSGQLMGGTAYGVFGDSKDEYPLGEVNYDTEAKQLVSIIFGENSLFASDEAYWAQGMGGIAKNPTTLFFSLDAWKEYQEENATEE